MKKIVLLLLCILSVGMAYSQSDVWRYDAQSGKWFQVIPFEPTTPKVETESPITNPKVIYQDQDGKTNIHSSFNKKEKYFYKSSKESITTNYKPWNVYGLVRTNLIGDALLVPNLGGEITVGKDWSLGADFYLQWIRNLDKDKFYKTYILDVDARYWWGRQHKKRQLTGWHVGPYGQAITYDMENGHKGYQSRVFFWTFAVGGELGYNLPLGKKQRWGLDFNIGLGYLHTKYNVYNPGHNKEYYFDHRQCRNYFGLTRIGVSLNYFIK